MSHVQRDVVSIGLRKGVGKMSITTNLPQMVQLLIKCLPHRHRRPRKLSTLLEFIFGHIKWLHPSRKGTSRKELGHFVWT